MTKERHNPNQKEHQRVPVVRQTNNLCGARTVWFNNGECRAVGVAVRDSIGHKPSTDSVLSVNPIFLQKRGVENWALPVPVATPNGTQDAIEIESCVPVNAVVFKRGPEGNLPVVLVEREVQHRHSATRSNAGKQTQKQSKFFHGLLALCTPRAISERLAFAGLFLFLALLCVNRSDAATITAASASEADVVTAIGLSSHGDIVEIPAGTGLWTNEITINKGIHLKGAGTASTIIEDWHSSGRLLSITLTDFKTNRVSGIQFKPGQTSTYYSAGTIYATGYDTNVNRIRIDNCIFTNLYRPMFEWNTALGVWDHVTNYFQVAAGGGFVKGSSWGGYSNGDGAWFEDDNFGTDKFLYFEDCHFEYVGSIVHPTFIDAQAGGRYVVRNSYLRKCALDGHGVESGQRERSTRAVEIYRNTYSGNDAGQQITYVRGGVGLVWSNTVSGYQGASLPMKLVVFRAGATFTPFNGATGTNAWDTNYAGGPFYSGTASGSNNLTVTVAGAGWTPSEWIGFSILRTTDIIGSGNQFHGIITANTSDTITWQTSAVAAELRIAVGDEFSIYRVAHALDQPGRCCDSTLLSGATPAVPANWHQLTSPWYEWGNTREAGADIDFANNHSIIVENVHFINDTAKPGYTPYTYPHPLIAATEGEQGGGEPPAPTPGLPAVGISGNVPLSGGVFVQ